MPSSTAMPNKAMKPTQIAVFMSTPMTATAIMPPAERHGNAGEDDQRDREIAKVKIDAAAG